MLNTLQQQAFDEILTGSSRIVVLLGEAGTGKSHTTSEIISAWRGSIAITATTNRAKEVLAEMSGKPTRTVQSQMGYRMVTQGYRQNLAKVSDASVADLVIVEEISMLPRAVYNTLLTHLESGDIKKILFLGDPVQLPSIGPGVSIGSIPGTHITLTEQMRQDSGDTALSTYLSSLRSAIESRIKIDITPTEDLTAVRFIEDHREFCELYLRTVGTKKVVAFTNSVVDTYNKHIHSEDSIFNPGDQLIIDKPFEGASNGDTVTVLAVVESDENYILECINGLGARGTILHWKTQRAYDEELARHKANRDEASYWSIANSSMRLKHQYACTVHKSQGSSYNTVFIDGYDIWQAHVKKKTKYSGPPISYDLFLRLMYVAISRMRTQCYIYTGTQRKYEYLHTKD